MFKTDAEWMFAVAQTVRRASLDARCAMMQTPDALDLTWAKGFLLKELKLHTTGRTRVAAEEEGNMCLTMDRIGYISASTAILANMITQEKVKALTDVRNGEKYFLLFEHMVLLTSC